MTIHEFNLEKFQNGDQKEFEYIYKKYHPALYHYANKLNPEDPAANEDCISETFVKTWNRRAQFESETNIKAFLYLCTKHAIFNILAINKRRKTSHTEIKYLSSEIDESSGIDLNIISSEILRSIDESIKTLPLKSGEVFRLYYFEKLTTAEVAKRLNIAEKTALNQKLTALARLQEQAKFLLR